VSSTIQTRMIFSPLRTKRIGALITDGLRVRSVTSCLDDMTPIARDTILRIVSEAEDSAHMRALPKHVGAGVKVGPTIFAEMTLDDAVRLHTELIEFDDPSAPRNPSLHPLAPHLGVESFSPEQAPLLIRQLLEQAGAEWVPGELRRTVDPVDQWLDGHVPQAWIPSVFAYIGELVRERTGGEWGIVTCRHTGFHEPCLRRANAVLRFADDVMLSLDTLNDDRWFSVMDYMRTGAGWLRFVPETPPKSPRSRVSVVSGDAILHAREQLYGESAPPLGSPVHFDGYPPLPPPPAGLAASSGTGGDASDEAIRAWCESTMPERVRALIQHLDAPPLQAHPIDVLRGVGEAILERASSGRFHAPMLFDAGFLLAQLLISRGDAAQPSSVRWAVLRSVSPGGGATITPVLTGFGSLVMEPFRSADDTLEEHGADAWVNVYRYWARLIP